MMKPRSMISARSCWRRGRCPTRTIRRITDQFGERGVIDLVGAVGYYSLVSMVLNVDRVPLPAGETPPLKPM